MRQLGTVKTCVTCGAEFHVKPSNWNRLINCSHACRGAYRAHKKREGQKPQYQSETDTYLVPLTRGYQAFIDACDIDLAKDAWYASGSGSDGPTYARRGIHQPGKRKVSILLHRVIMARLLGRELTDDELVDHIDGNTMNNRRSNLRVATHAQNVRNGPGRKAALKGACRNVRTGGFTAQIQVDGKKLTLGRFATAEAAHEAYVRAAIELHGEFAHDGLQSLADHKEPSHE